jgi:hypothetical protein
VTRLHPLLLTLLAACAAPGAGTSKSSESGSQDVIGSADAGQLVDSGGAEAGGVEEEDRGATDTGGGEDVASGGDAVEDEAAGPQGGLWPRELVLRDEDGDGRWRAGELAELQVSLYNAGESSYVDLPGLRLGVESELVVVPEPEVWVYSIEPGTSATLSFWMVASPTLDAETAVELTVSVASQGCGPDTHPCPDPNPVSLWATLQP